MELTSQAREQYHEMIDGLAKEIAEHGGIFKGSSGLYFSHMGHSRTPSGCSAISFSSSILSEPLTSEQKSDAYDSGRATNSESVSPLMQLSILCCLKRRQLQFSLINFSWPLVLLRAVQLKRVVPPYRMIYMTLMKVMKLILKIMSTSIIKLIPFQTQVS